MPEGNPEEGRGGEETSLAEAAGGVIEAATQDIELVVAEVRDAAKSAIEKVRKAVPRKAARKSPAPPKKAAPPKAAARGKKPAPKKAAGKKAAAKARKAPARGAGTKGAKAKKRTRR